MPDLGLVTAVHDSPANFAYLGDIKLFGVLPGQIYIYEHVSDTLHPYTEVIKIAQSSHLSLATFLPSLKDSDWDAVVLHNTIFGFREETSIGNAFNQQVGFHLETDMAFQGALQPVSDFLHDFFHQETSAIRFSARLCQDRCYGKMIHPSNIVLRGSLNHISVNVLNILEFSEVGVELTGRHLYDTSAKSMKWKLDYGFFGRLNLSVPGTVVPLQVEYYLRKSMNSWLLSVRFTDDEWNDIFGVKGLKVGSSFKSLINSC